MRRWILAIIAVNLAGLVALTFIEPDAMLAPGALIPAHAGLSDSCFACHAPLQGAVEARCVTCHAVADIGLRTVAGAPVAAGTMIPFHQALGDTDCMGCHTDHPAPSLTPSHSRSFAHAMLTPAAGADCSGCHAPPADLVHVAPVAQCSGCHSQTTWAAAAIDHARFFALSGPHDVGCISCHTTAGDFTRYTCFSCHEHQEAKLIREHREEGIRNIDDCVACHRDAHGEGREGHGDDD